MMTTGDILIVDDERDIRALIGATLRDEGYPTVEAATAGEARDILAAKPPGLAIFDIWMRDSVWTALNCSNGRKVSIRSCPC